MFKYINLKDKENRERAIKLVRETEEMAIHTQEPICITKKRADELIYKASDHLRMLELMLENDDKPESPYYNWLENE
ncbi:hypothetical protein [Salinibacillus kushneri]|nr:hypothetical protein [Salinibacillus kushneri]